VPVICLTTFPPVAGTDAARAARAVPRRLLAGGGDAEAEGTAGRATVADGLALATVADGLALLTVADGSALLTKIDANLALATGTRLTAALSAGVGVAFGALTAEKDATTWLITSDALTPLGREITFVAVDLEMTLALAVDDAEVGSSSGTVIVTIAGPAAEEVEAGSSPDEDELSAEEVGSAASAELEEAPSASVGVGELASALEEVPSVGSAASAELEEAPSASVGVGELASALEEVPSVGSALSVGVAEPSAEAVSAGASAPAGAEPSAGAEVSAAAAAS
jgi:hypothetical protein